MLTLRAAGLVDVEAGEIVRPGIVRVEDDRIVGIGGDAHSEGEIIDLGESILLPGLMDMEVNLLMGGRGENPGLSQVQDDPPTRVLRAVGNARGTRDLALLRNHRTADAQREFLHSTRR